MSRWQTELRALFGLMAPILITQLAQAGYGFVDTLMAGQVSALDLAAVAIGSGLWLPMFLLIAGIVMATTPLVAAAYGAGRYTEVPRLTHQALWVGLMVGLLGMMVLYHISVVFPWLGVPSHLQAKTELYLHGIAFGMPPVAIFCTLRYYCEALSHTKPVMILSVLGVLFNIPANYVFIYGAGWFPALGGAGCGWATAVVMFNEMLLIMAYVLLAPSLKPYRLLQHDGLPNWSMMKHVFKLGLPIGMAIFFEVSIFSLVAVLVSPLGEQTVAAHQISLSVTSLLFMVPLSLAISMTIRIGQAYGRHDIAGIRLTRQTGLLTTSIIASCSALSIILFREQITHLYSADVNVCQLAADLLLFAAGYQIFDALQVGAAGCLRGIQDTKGPMYLTLIAYWLIALPIGYSLGMLPLWHGHTWGAYGFWVGLVVGLGIACLLLNWRLRQQIKRLTQRWH